MARKGVAEEEESDSGPGAARLDRWLFAVRLFKSRSLAAQAVSGGRVHVNGLRVRPAHALRPGDLVSFVRGAAEFECAVASIPARRGPAPAAVRCYEETAASQARRVEISQRLRTAAELTSPPRERPGKHERRELRRLRGR